MRARDLLERFAERPFGDRLAWRAVLLGCLLYALGFFAFYPNVITNDDESLYVRQTLLVLEGTSSVPKLNARSGEFEAHIPSTYPYGTALSMSLPAAIFGWRGAYLAPFAALIGGALILARWLQQEGRSPLFALLVLGYPPALVMGRVAMSDVPSAFLAILGLWLFWRGIDRDWKWWIASGFVAGGSMLFRESNPIVFAAFFAGALLRRERNVWALIVGGLAGLGLRVAANALFLEQPLHFRSPYLLALSTLPERIPIYALALLVFVPGGLVFSLLYRGRRWPELCVAVTSFVAAYLVQAYYTFATSLLKNMIVTPRYVIPIVPVIVFGMAESMPRLWGRLLERAGEARRDALQTAAGIVLATWLAGVLIASFSVHPAFAAWAGRQAEIREAVVAHVDPEAVVITNLIATRKFLPTLSLKFIPLERHLVSVATANELVERWGAVCLVFLARSDSEFWSQQGQEDLDFVNAMSPTPELVFDQSYTATDRLRIWRARRSEGRAD